MDNLSKRAREEYNKLTQKLQEVISSDKVREPKLTEEEKAEISEREARIEHLKPIIEKLHDLMETKDTRLNFLERHSQQLIIEGEEVDDIAAELVLLKPALVLLENAYRVVSMETTMAESKIKDIKEAARKRELREEAHNGQ